MSSGGYSSESDQREAPRPASSSSTGNRVSSTTEAPSSGSVPSGAGGSGSTERASSTVVSNHHIDALRGTPEYAALFQMEVWQAEQRKKFAHTMELEREALRKEIEAEYAERDADRVAELDQFRHELEQMAVGLKRSGEALQRRIVALEKRESAFEARRLQSAKEHEGILLAAESKSRQVRDELSHKTELLESKVHEKERVVQQTLQRLQSLNTEYETLQSLMSRVQADEANRQREILKINQQLKDTVKLLEEARQEAKEANKQRDEAVADSKELRDACTHYKRQLKELAAQHNELLRQMSANQMSQIAEERKRLEQEKYEAEAKASRDRAALQQSSSQNARNQPQGAFEAASPNSDVSALRRLVEDLVAATDRANRESEEQERERRREKKLKKKQKEMAREDRGRMYVPLQADARVREEYSSSAVTPPPPGFHHDHRETTPQRRTEEPPRTPSRGYEGMDRRDDSSVSVSSLSEGAEAERSRRHDQSLGQRSSKDSDVLHSSNQRTSVSPSPNSRLGDHLRLTERDDDYPHRHDTVGRDEDDEEEDFDEGAARTAAEFLNAPRPDYDYSSHVRPHTPPPDVPHYPPTSTGGEATAPTERSDRDQLEQDGSESRGKPQAPFPSSDIVDFVNRLRANHDRLLETGVYTKEDTLIREMERKIAVYEEFLRTHQGKSVGSVKPGEGDKENATARGKSGKSSEVI